jgi:UDP-2-acetamido-3-amino-2,3-dideoxy-glucuronate N-acetyltransferase
VTIDSRALVHPTAVVDDGATIGAGSKVWHFCHVMAGARVGADCVLGQNCYVADGVRIGDRVRVQNNVSLYDGVELEDDVFVGPSVVFTNVKNPRASVDRKAEYARTLVRQGATLGANATILCGVTLGRWSFVAAGAVVTHDVDDFRLVMGAPARPVGWVSRHGAELRVGGDGRATCPATGESYRTEGGKLVRDE